MPVGNCFKKCDFFGLPRNVKNVTLIREAFTSLVTSCRGTNWSGGNCSHWNSLPLHSAQYFHPTRSEITAKQSLIAFRVRAETCLQREFDAQAESERARKDENGERRDIESYKQTVRPLTVPKQILSGKSRLNLFEFGATR